MAEATRDTDCPVCGDDYTHPKLLPCNHLVCRKCVLDWLTKAGEKAGCPLCRAPILPSSSSPSTPSTPSSSSSSFASSSPSSSLNLIDLETLIDDLPTDLALVAKLESKKTVQSSHVCMFCDSSSQTPATAFCLQCNMKLCKACASGHTKIPTLKNHRVEDLDKLTTEQLAEMTRVMCSSHDDRLTEMYCVDHQVLVCTLCATTEHRMCAHVLTVEKAAEETREFFKQEVVRLREKETAMRSQLKSATCTFKTMREKSTTLFDELRQCIDRRQTQMEQLIQKEEEKANLQQLDKDRASLTSHAGVIDNMVTSAPDDALLDMTKKMKGRLSDLQQQIDKHGVILENPDVVFDEDEVAQLKSAISSLGQITDPTYSTPYASGVVQAKRDPPPLPPVSTDSHPLTYDSLQQPRNTPCDPSSVYQTLSGSSVDATSSLAPSSLSQSVQDIGGRNSSKSLHKNTFKRSWLTTVGKMLHGNKSPPEFKKDFSHLGSRQRRTKLQQKIQELESACQQQRRDLEGCKKLLHVYTANPQLGDPEAMKKVAQESHYALRSLEREKLIFQGYLAECLGLRANTTADTIQPSDSA